MFGTKSINFKWFFFILYIVDILLLVPTLGIPHARHLIFLVLAMGMALGIERFFKYTNRYYISLLLLYIFYNSIFWCVLHGNIQTPLEMKDYITYKSFEIFVGLLILTITNLIKNKLYRICIGLLLFLITVFPITLIWSYYFSTQSFLTVESCMAILQTNPSEAWQYISDHSSIMRIIGITTVFVGGAFVFLSIQSCTMQLRARKLKWILCFLMIMDLLMIYRTRENVVGNLIYDTRVYSLQYENYQKNREQRIENLSSLPDLSNEGKPGVYILVIGESETRDRMGVYGYNRDTTPWLNSVKEKENIIIFNKSWSCANDTVRALTYALTNKNQYNDINLDKAFSLIEVANAAGYDTAWISNQVQYGLADTPITAIASEAKQQVWLRDKVGHMKDGRYLDIPNYFDEKVLSGLDELNYSDKMLIVIHIMGSHNSYKVRYPKEFANFSGDYSDEYDNSVLYTDYILRRIIDKTENIPNFQGMIYFSDHGEGIDDNVGHDNNSFTYQMTRIPMFMYMSPSFVKNRHEDYTNLFIKRNDYFTNDLIFELMLGIMGVVDKRLMNDSDMLMLPQYNNDVNRFYTSYGKRKIIDDPTIEK